jgi:ActD protein
MSDQMTLIGLFTEVASVGQALDDLHNLGIPENKIVVISGVPYPEGALGHHREWLALPYIVVAGAISGFIFGLFLAVITPHLYRLDVGGHPTVGAAPAAVIVFVFTMMATIVSTFLGVLWEMNFPRFRPAPYHHLVTDGYLALLLEFSAALEADVRQVFENYHADHVGDPERLGE